MLVKKHRSPGVGPNEAHGLWHQKASAQNPPGYSGRSAPPGVAALVLPQCDTRGMQWHLEEISSQVEPGAHALIILDKAGWHTTGKLDIPDNITLLPLPPRSPELNPVENVWQYLRQNRLSNRIFDNQDQIVSLCCDAWNNLTERPSKIRSIGYRKWAHGF